MATSNKANAMAAIVASNDVAQKIVAADKAEKAAPKKAAEKAAPQARTTRPAQTKKVETTKPAATVAAATAKAIPVKFMLNPSIRPGAGKLLFSHTEAVLQLLGMYKGEAHPAEILDALMGSTAVKYHTDKGRFMAGKKGLSLTSDGKAHFAKRGMTGNKEQFVAQDVEAYKTIFTGGQVDGRVVKNQAMIKPFAASVLK